MSIVAGGGWRSHKHATRAVWALALETVGVLLMLAGTFLGNLILGTLCCFGGLALSLVGVVMSLRGWPRKAGGGTERVHNRPTECHKTP